MRSTEALRELSALNLPLVTTAEAALRLQLSPTATVKALNRLVEDGLIAKLRQGEWIVGEVGDPRLLTPYLTAPYPAYVSSFTALADHGMIDQLPKTLSVVSLDRAQTIPTSVATFAIQHIHPVLFGGFIDDPRGFSLATPEKALFDTFYLQAARGQVAQVEIELPHNFDLGALADWCERIPSPRMKTMTIKSLQVVIQENGLTLPITKDREL